ncbi:MAG: hypothetical protein VX995_01525 [Thermoproteota archaeon]|nr:hypothetical protein [Thermoproteota archaeon]MED5275874.1 hypothetical protein [Thermoproteota archaeon]|tara:strand:+ start:495 stop:1331 length:837 start_codon:yes stop_codon:yes gene_type:complete
MRIGNPTNNEFFLELNKINEDIQNSFLKRMVHETRNVSCDVMLGDSTTKKVETFDVKNVETFFGKFESHLPEWNSQGVTYSSDEDLRRIFVKSEIKIGNYILSLHASLQYHVLLYYKPIQKVIDLQKKLSELIDAGGNSESKYEEESDRLIIEKLNELGFKDMPKQELFELFYNDEELSNKIKKMIDDSQPEVVDIQGQKNQLFKELDNLLIEIFQTTSALIDEQKLVNGEEGCLCNIDLEYVDEGAKQGLVDASLIDEKHRVLIKQNITKLLDIILE